MHALTATPDELQAALRRDFARHREFLWGLCYRMTGSAADADDLVQDTFERALAKPPEDVERGLRPWLARVAVRLCCDQLRRRKRAPYRGTWLPEPVPTEELTRAAPRARRAAKRAMRLLESATFAFLIALEALSPAQRAVLLLRDVFDYSVRETAEALELSEANVKTTLHRARAAMADVRRRALHPDARAAPPHRTGAAALHAAPLDRQRARDRGAAARRRGRAQRRRASSSPRASRWSAATRWRSSTARSRCFIDKKPRFAIRDLNGLPAIVFEYEPTRTDFARRQIFRVDLDARGRIREIHSVLASAKLRRVRFDRLRGSACCNA